MPEKSNPSETTTAQELERLGAGSSSDTCCLVLYVAGMAPKSLKAYSTIRELCGKYLGGRYELTVVDIYQQPELAKEAQIVAAPTLIKLSPLPVRRMIGDLADRQRILSALKL